MSTIGHRYVLHYFPNSVLYNPEEADACISYLESLCAAQGIDTSVHYMPVTVNG